MTPEKQVSPVIRISQGERDASARATHLEAATRKFLVTTNERKQMSTKTNFKRIALVAVASLGLSLISAAPSQAVVSTPTITGVAAGSGGLTINSKADSLTAATFTVQTFMNTIGDSLTVTVSPANTNAESTTVLALLYLTDTGFAGTQVDTSAAYNGNGSTANIAGNQRLVSSVVNKTDTVGVTSGVSSGLYIISVDTNVVSTGVANAKASFSLQLDSGYAAVAPGTYSYTVDIRSYDAGVATARSVTQTISIVVSRTTAEAASLSPTVSSSTSYVVMGDGTTNLGDVSDTSATTTDSAISVVATAATTDHAVLRVRLRNASSGNAQESVTAVITAGRIGDGTTMGRSVTLPYTSTDVTAGYKDLVVEADGTAGTATITVSTPSVTFATKTINFYSAAPKAYVVTTATPLLRVGSNADAVRVTATDANGLPWTGTLYVYATEAADVLIAGTTRATGTTCAYDSDDKRHECSITGTSVGTAKLTISNYATAALATAAANGAEVTGTATVVVSSAVPATVKIEFDKATYAPSERARIYVTPLDSSGKAMQVATYTNLFASGGISTASGLVFAGSTTTADSLTAVTITTKANSSAATGARAGSMEYTVFMPAAGGTVTLSATGGSGLPLAGRVAVTASATVTDSGAAALAAVNALATTVASLKTLITTLTNLVLKIQKKVKA